MRVSLALLLLIAGCSERRFAGPPPAGTLPPALAAGGESAGDAGLPAPDAPAASWLDAVRLERWAEAAALLDALPEVSRSRAEMRYVRARAAVGSGDGARASTLLDGLEASLPLLSADIARWRAEAQLLVGPYAPAAAYFARSHTARDLTRAADAYQKAGDNAAARAVADRAVVAAGHGRGVREEAAARTKRAEILRAAGGDAGNAAAEPDLRWVATHAASTAEGRAAAQALEQMKRPLSPKERISALEGIDPAATGTTVSAPVVEQVAGQAGAVTTAQPVSSLPAPAHAAEPRPKPAPSPVLRGEALHARAMALYRAREYTAAATAFRESAVAGAHQAEDLHYAARSLARADHDDDAVKAYQAMILRYPRSPFAEKSAYYAGRLELSDGHFKEAAQSYTRYLTTYRKGEHREEAEYERALAWLSSGSPGPAREALTLLARKAPADKAPRLRELVAIAADRDGDHPGAVALWTEIARTQPLTWAALTARARLAAAGSPLPPPLDPDPTEAARGSRAILELRLPPTSALLASLGLDGDAETHLLEVEREATAPYAGRESEALCGLYGMLTRAKRRYRIGVGAVDGSWLLRAPSSTERWAWDCVYPRPFATGVRALEEQHALPRGLVYAVMRQESGFDPAVVSPASAVGLMQLMPATARQAALELALPFDESDLTRPEVNLRLGAFYIAKLLRMFQGHVALAAAAYNAGPRAVSRWVESSSSTENDLDLWVARIPFDETRNYVARVAQNLARYQWLEGGDAAVTPVALAIPADARAPADAY